MQYNVKFARLEEGMLKYAPNPIKTLGADIFTDDGARYLLEGYKRVARAAMPAPVDGYTWTYTWVESETEITQTWTQVAIPDEPSISDYRAALAELGVSLDD